MHKFTHCLFSLLLNSDLYSIYKELYDGGRVLNPLIYSNHIKDYIHPMIPVLHTKFIFNQQYNYIITDQASVKILKNTFRHNGDNVLIYKEQFDNFESLCGLLGIKL